MQGVPQTGILAPKSPAHPYQGVLWPGGLLSMVATTPRGIRLTVWAESRCCFYGWVSRR